MRRGTVLSAALLCAALAGCGGSGSDGESGADASAEGIAGSSLTTGAAASTGPSGSSGSTGAETTTTTEGEDAEDSSGTTLPPGALAGLEDFDGSGAPDPTCGTQDFGAGLVLRIPCEITTPNEPEDGATLVEGSLYRLPGAIDIDLDGISGSLLLARDEAGQKVVIVVFNSDNLFATGSAELGSTDTMDNTVRLINDRYPGSAIQVRGHTDATGSAQGNQALSEARATNARDYLIAQGVVAGEATSVGLGAGQPLALEVNPDGSENVDGQRFNRRVEIVLRVP